MRRIFILGFFILTGCSGPKKNNSSVLPEEKMVAILTDVQLADAAARERLLPPEYQQNPQRWYVEIMTFHSTDTATFSASLRYYTSRPDVLRKIYKEVNSNLLKELGGPPPKKE